MPLVAVVELPVPQTAQRSVRSVDWIRPGHGHLRNGFEGTRTLFLLALAFVVNSAPRVGRNNQQIVACPKALMSRSGRQYRDILDSQAEGFPAVASEFDPSMAACDPEHPRVARMLRHLILDSSSP